MYIHYSNSRIVKEIFHLNDCAGECINFLRLAGRELKTFHWYSRSHNWVLLLFFFQSVLYKRILLIHQIISDLRYESLNGVRYPLDKRKEKKIGQENQSVNISENLSYPDFNRAGNGSIPRLIKSS